MWGRTEAYDSDVQLTSCAVPYFGIHHQGGDLYLHHLAQNHTSPLKNLLRWIIICLERQFWANVSYKLVFTTLVSKYVSRLCVNMDVSRHILVCRSIVSRKKVATVILNGGIVPSSLYIISRTLALALLFSMQPNSLPPPTYHSIAMSFHLVTSLSQSRQARAPPSLLPSCLIGELISPMWAPHRHAPSPLVVSSTPSLVVYTIIDLQHMLLVGALANLCLFPQFTPAGCRALRASSSSICDTHTSPLWTLRWIFLR
jgi:hypothetical protein